MFRFMFFMFVVLILYFFGILNEGIHKISDVKHEMFEYVGTDFIFEDDTLKIVDYSIFSETYTLSNGLVISRKIVE